MQKNNLTLKILALILLTDLLESAYEFFFKKGMLLVGEFNFPSIGEFIINTGSCPWIWIGLTILFAELFLWFFILSRIDLSVALPVGSASYIFVLLISAFSLNEPVGLNRWLGTLIIICGISLIAKSSREKCAQETKT